MLIRLGFLGRDCILSKRCLVLRKGWCKVKAELCEQYFEVFYELQTHILYVWNVDETIIE